MDKLELQRLVDGELNRDRRRQILQHLDEEPTQWRDVALALLEEQDFRSELGSRTIPSSESCESVMLASGGTMTTTTTNASSSDNWSEKGQHWISMALAASILVGFGFVGGNWLASQFDGMNSSGSNAAGPSIALSPKDRDTNRNLASENLSNATSLPSENGASSGLASLQPVGQLSFASDSNSTVDGHAMKLPIYEAAPEQIQQMLLSQQLQIQQWNEHLRRRGFELDWRPEMIESRLPDGRPVIVPIQQVNLRSLGQ